MSQNQNGISSHSSNIVFLLNLVPEDGEHWQVVLGLAAVQQELVVQLRRPVALARRPRLDREVLPVRLHQVLRGKAEKAQSHMCC